MKFAIVAAGLVAVAAAASGQEQASRWSYFEGEGGMTGAAVQAADGSQLILKCDKPGRREVYAMVVSGDARLAVPNQRPISRPITVRADGKSPETGDWRFYERYATALGKTSDRTLARFVVDLRNASSLNMRLDTGISQDVVVDFDVTGASEVVPHVYEVCKDTMPA
ncbi:MAG TPA: hypothetical protein VEB68_12705 [Croceibacterium sp.]|nr:hypothetical protein [Croceibacterium sp.]